MKFAVIALLVGCLLCPAALANDTVDEAKYRKQLNELQLNKNFGNGEAGAVLELLAPVLRRQNKTSEADDATKLAAQIRDGKIPIETNAQVYMRADKSIAVMKRFAPDDDNYGFAYVELKPEDEAYAPTIAAVGGLVPGEGKLMPPTLELPDEAMGMARFKAGQMGVFGKFNYRYKVGGEQKLVTLDNKKMLGTTLFDLSAMLDHATKYSAREEYLAAYKQDAEQMSLHDRMALPMFLNGPASAKLLYPWLSMPHVPEMQTEDLNLLAKCFAGVQKWVDAELAKNKDKKTTPTQQEPQQPSQQQQQERTQR